MGRGRMDESTKSLGRMDQSTKSVGRMGQSTESLSGELSGPLSIDVIKPSSPKFSISSRTFMPHEKPNTAPGPGHYGECPPTTVTKNHPTLATSGRGWHFGTSQRSQSTGALLVGGPGPNQYPVKYGQAKYVEPSWVIGERLGHDLAGRPPHKDTWPTSLSKLEKGVPMRDTRHLTAKGGVMKSPEYKIGEKMDSSLMAKFPGQISPGPAKYDWQVEALGRIKRPPTWAFSSSDRFPKGAAGMRNTF